MEGTPCGSVSGVLIAAIGGTPQTEWLLARAMELAKERGLRLHLLHVVDPAFLEAHVHVPRSTREGLIHLGELLLERCQRSVEKAGATCDTELRRGDLMEELEAVIEETGAEVLVVGVHKARFLRENRPHPWERLHTEHPIEVVELDPDAED